jgi:glycerol-3-phosphate dehydrogenase (NAD(P)+)
MKLAVLGAGAWGTAIASIAAARHDVTLWARDSAQAAAIARARENQRYLPGIALDARLKPSADLAASVAGAGLIVIATPTEALRATLQALRETSARAPIVWLCKGFEAHGDRPGVLAHQIALEVMGDSAADTSGPLSGPSFADEVARGLPAALTVAGAPAFCDTVTQALHHGALRIYSTDDVIGVEVGGAVKNVLAIATGVCDALALGHNARAALITRGLAEITRLGLALGARAETFMGLTGVGDLILTCTGELSRNRKVGLLLGRGVPLAEALAQLGHVAEGVLSAPAVLARAHALNVPMPITEAVCDLLAQRAAPREALERLLARDAKAERT